MKSEVLKNFAMTNLTVAGLILFILVFSSVIFWVFRKGSKNIYQEISEGMLSDDKKVGEQ